MDTLLTTLCLTSCTYLDQVGIPICSPSIDCCARVRSDSTRYYHCKNGILDIGQCPLGFAYNSISTQCTSQLCSSQCITTNCSGIGNCCSADPSNCMYYFKCLGGERLVEQCPVGMGFDPKSLTCVEGLECYLNEDLSQCLQNQCGHRECTDSAKCCVMLTPFKCGPGYMVCKEGRINPVTCPPGSRYSNSALKCERNCGFQDSATEYGITSTAHPNIAEVGNRRLLSREEFLSAVYSVYTQWGNQLTVPVHT